MLIPIKFLEYMGFIQTTEMLDNEPSSEDLLEEHIKESILETSMEHIDTDKATRGSQNIKALAEAKEHLEKAKCERKKIELQIAEANQRRYVNWDIVLPKLIGIAVTGAVTVFWLCLEQGTPIPMRLVKMTTDLTVPRGL